MKRYIYAWRERSVADLVTETHGIVKRIEGELKGINIEMKNGKRQRSELYSQIDELEKTTVKKTDCEKTSLSLENTIPTLVENAVNKTMNGRKRSRWLVTKDILLAVLGPIVGALLGYFFFLSQRGTP